MDEHNSQKSSRSVKGVVEALSNRVKNSTKILAYDAYELGYMRALEELRKIETTTMYADSLEELWNSGKVE
jgi:hypothetical protein